jgi:hypothetical protein
MSCSPPNIVVEGLSFSTSQWENVKELVNAIGDATTDPTLDGYDENIANGNNNLNQTGTNVQTNIEQTTPPNDINQKANSVDNKRPPQQGPGIDPGCPLVLPDPLYTYQLSTNYMVKDLCYATLEKAQLVNSFGLTALERLCNMKAVAINILEPLRAKFGTAVQINSGLRSINSAKPPNISQHCAGQAVDIQFAGWTYNMYWENASWVRDNINYDQFIFEHSTKTKLAWYHLSYNIAGNRSVSDRTKVMTMYLNSYSSGLQRHF